MANLYFAQPHTERASTPRNAPDRCGRANALKVTGSDTPSDATRGRSDPRGASLRLRNERAERWRQVLASDIARRAQAQRVRVASRDAATARAPARSSDLRAHKPSRWIAE